MTFSDFNYFKIFLRRGLLLGNNIATISSCDVQTEQIKKWSVEKLKLVPTQVTLPSFGKWFFNLIAKILTFYIWSWFFE